MGLIVPEIDAKLRRATEKIDSLTAEVFGSPERGPDENIITYFDPKRSSICVGFRVSPLVLARYGILLGEIVQCLRSTLDYLACVLVKRRNGTPTNRTQFPIRISNLNKRGNQRDPIDIHGGVEPAALALIERLQPYHAGNLAQLEPLAILAELSNIDKHRTLLAASTLALIGEISIGLLLDGQERARLTQSHFSRPAQNGAVFAEFPISSPPQTHEMKVDAHGLVQIFIQEPGAGVNGKPILVVAEMLQAEVLRVLRLFRRWW